MFKKENLERLKLHVSVMAGSLKDIRYLLMNGQVTCEFDMSEQAELHALMVLLYSASGDRHSGVCLSEFKTCHLSDCARQ